MIVVHDFAYADVGFDGYQPPSILQAEGAKECAVELYSMTKSFSMAGWRCAFLLGNAEVVQALVKLKSYLDYGMFQPVQIAATVTINEAPDFPKEVCATYQRRRDALIDGLGRIGWDIPKPGGLDVRVGADPRALRRAGLGRVLLDASCATPTSRSRPASASGPAARASPASPSSRTRSASPRASATCAAASPSSADDRPSRVHDGAQTDTGARHGADTVDRVPSAMPVRWSSASGCPTGRARSARWPAGSAPSTATSSRSTSSSGAAAGSSTSWSSSLPDATSTSCWSRRSAPSTASSVEHIRPRRRRAARLGARRSSTLAAQRGRPAAVRAAGRAARRARRRRRRRLGGRASATASVVHRRGDAARVGLAARVPRRQRAPRRRPPVDAAPGDLVWARLPRAGIVVAAGRARPPGARARAVRVALLAAIADALLIGCTRA